MFLEKRLHSQTLDRECESGDALQESAEALRGASRFRSVLGDRRRFRRQTAMPGAMSIRGFQRRGVFDMRIKKTEIVRRGR